ncbi:MAG: HAD-IA family hydrolase [Rhodospirillaceae bacterium]
MSQSLRLVLLDVDGTLADSQHNIVAAMADACTECGLPMPPARAVHRVIGLSLVEAVATLMPEADPDTHLRVSEAYKQAFMTRRAAPDHEEHLFAGARQAIEDLDAAGVLLGIATGKSHRGAIKFIERHGLERYFVTVQTADGGAGKPDPRMARDALAETGVAPHLAVMVGDTTFDMMMARAAGIGGIGVSWGNHAPVELRRAGAATVLEDFADLRAAVDALTGAAQVT